MIDGNLENKYASTNPIHQYLMKGFLNHFDILTDKISQPKSILEVGAGEGHITERLIKKFPKSKIEASDISKRIIKHAQSRSSQLDAITWHQEQLEKLTHTDNSFDLIVCCEVLEHTSDPHQSLAELHRVTRKHLIISVPQEPIWRILNLSRGKYISRFGNTPGHLNHWSPSGFIKLLTSHKFQIQQVAHPFPWTMVLASIQDSSTTN